MKLVIYSAVYFLSYFSVFAEYEIRSYTPDYYSNDAYDYLGASTPITMSSSGDTVALAYDDKITTPGYVHSSSNYGWKAFRVVSGNYEALGGLVSEASRVHALKLGENGNTAIVLLKQNSQNQHILKRYNFNGSNWIQTYSTTIFTSQENQDSNLSIHTTNDLESILVVKDANSNSSYTTDAWAKVIEYDSNQYIQKGQTITIGATIWNSFQNEMVYEDISGDGQRIAFTHLNTVWSPLYSRTATLKVYEFDSESNSWIGAMNDKDLSGHVLSNLSLNFDGSIIALANPYHILNDSSVGRLSVYSAVDRSWSLMGSHCVGSDDQELGNMIRLSDDGMRVVTSNNYYGEGSISVFEYENESWVEKSTYSEASNDEPEQQLGHSLEASYDGSHILAVSRNVSNGNDLGVGKFSILRYLNFFTLNVINLNTNYGILSFSDGNHKFEGGTEIQISAIPLAGYQFDYFDLNGEKDYSDTKSFVLNDDVSISASFSLKTPVIAPLDNFYESDNSTSIDIDILTINEVQTPSFQWYLNGYLIPAVFGGNNSSFTILGDLSSEGTWRVAVTNDAGTTSAEFEYRVFVDSDSDGYSDYRESNILGTNPNNADTDGDGLSDYDELETHSTQPTLADSNGDGFSDGVIFNSGLSLSTNYSLLSQDLLSGQKDLRVGSKISSVANDVATLQVVLEESEDLDSWTERQTIDLSVPLQDGETTKFFRYKMTD